MTKTTLLVPTSDVRFMALKKPVGGFGDKAEVLKYTIDGSTQAGQELRAKIADINPNRINTKAAQKDGNFVLTLASSFPPKVLDSEGQLLNQEDIPQLGKGGSAKAKLEVIVDESRANKALKVKGAMYLGAVQLTHVDIGTSSDSTAA